MVAELLAPAARSRRSRWAAPGDACWPSRSSPASPCRRSTTRRWTATPCARRTSPGRRTTARSTLPVTADIPAGRTDVPAACARHRPPDHDRAPRCPQEPTRSCRSSTPTAATTGCGCSGLPRRAPRSAGPARTSPTATVVLPAGTVLGAAQIGVAAAVGAATLPVRRRPTVLVLSTGSELVAPGHAAAAGADLRVERPDARRRGGGRRRRRRAAAVRARRRRAPAPRARRAPGGRHRRPRPHLGRGQRGRLRGGQGGARAAGASSSSRSRCSRAGRRARGRVGRRRGRRAARATR